MGRDFLKRLTPLAILGAVACEQDTLTVVPLGLELQFAALTDPTSYTGCTATTNGAGKLPTGDKDGVARLKVRWKVLDRPDLPATAQSGQASVLATDLAKTGTWAVPDLPASGRVSIEVYGCNAEAKPRVVWYGKSADLTVKDGEETTARVFMTQPGKASCTGSLGGKALLQSPRGFSGGAALPGGNAVVVGGADAWDAKDKAVSASVATDVYDYRMGRWSAGPNLNAARIQPTVVALGGDKVLVVGGHTRTLQSHPTLPLTLFAPDLTTVPTVAAEILDLSSAALSAKASPADVGNGALPLARGVVAGDSVVFAGGFDQAGAAVAVGTRLSGFADLAQLGKGTTQALTLVTPRVQPALLAFADGTVVIWGGQTQKGAPLGELIRKDGTAGIALTVSPDAVVQDPNVATLGPAAVVVAEVGDKLTFFVTGGSPVDDVWVTRTPSYFVTVDRSASPGPTAVCQPVRVGDSELPGGLGVALVRVDPTHLLVMGGLLALSKPTSEEDPLGLCQTEAQTQKGCVVGGFQLLTLPTDWSSATLTLQSTPVATAASFAPHFGALSVPLPVGALTVGGMLSAVGPVAEADVFDGAAQVVTAPFEDAASDDVCAP